MADNLSVGCSKTSAESDYCKEEGPFPSELTLPPLLWWVGRFKSSSYFLLLDSGLYNNSYLVAVLRDSITSQILHVKNPSAITTGKHNFQKLTVAQECHITGGGDKMYKRVMRKNTCHNRFKLLSRWTNTVSECFELIFKIWPTKQTDPSLESRREINFIIYCKVRPNICRLNWQILTHSEHSVFFLSSSLVPNINTEVFFPERFLLSVNDAAQMPYVFSGCNQFAKA